MLAMTNGESPFSLQRLLNYEPRLEMGDRSPNCFHAGCRSHLVLPLSAYYNENDPKAAAWLRELIKVGAIASGTVDERSIEDVTPNDLRDFTQHHFFAGIGGWSYALRLAGWPDERPVWTGSCPCQPFSSAGAGRGFADKRHLWPNWFWLIGQCRPSIIFGEQVANALPWLDLVQSDLEAEELAFWAAIIGAHSVGAPHIRQRIYWVAESKSEQSYWRGDSRRRAATTYRRSRLGQRRRLTTHRADRRLRRRSTGRSMAAPVW